MIQILIFLHLQKLVLLSKMWKVFNAPINGIDAPINEILFLSDKSLIYEKDF